MARTAQQANAGIRMIAAMSFSTPELVLNFCAGKS
jgi:hypothetical protein